MTKNKNQGKQENPLASILLNIAIPSILLMKGGKWFGYKPETILVIALLFPIIYGLYDFITRRKYNFISILGFVSILLTGGIGLMKLSKDWIAVKEAAVPLTIGAVVLISLKTKYPLIKTLLYNDTIMNVEKVDARLRAHHKKKAFDKLLVKATWLITFSFILSSILNYALAKYFIQHETGTAEFTEELGRMTAWSYPVIALPCTAVMMYTLWMIFKGIKEMTGMELEEVFHHPHLKDVEKKTN